MPLVGSFAAGCTAAGDDADSQSATPAGDELVGHTVEKSAVYGLWRTFPPEQVVTSDGHLARFVGTHVTQSVTRDGVPSGFEIRMYEDNTFEATLFRCDASGRIETCSSLSLTDARMLAERDEIVQMYDFPWRVLRPDILGASGRWRRSFKFQLFAGYNTDTSYEPDVVFKWSDDSRDRKTLYGTGWTATTMATFSEQSKIFASAVLNDPARFYRFADKVQKL